MATVAYLRVSTVGQSVEAQLCEIRAAGYDPDTALTFSEVGVSGSCQALQRPEFARMFGKLRSGDLLVVQKLDRLGRDAIDVQATVRDLEALGVKVVVLNLGGADLTSPSGKLMLTMLSAVAEMERDLIRERTKAGLEAAKARGVKLGGKRERKDAGKIAERFKAGESVAELAREFGITRQGVYALARRHGIDTETREQVAQPKKGRK